MSQLTTSMKMLYFCKNRTPDIGDSICWVVKMTHVKYAKEHRSEMFLDAFESSFLGLSSPYLAWPLRPCLRKSGPELTLISQYSVVSSMYSSTPEAMYTTHGGLPTALELLQVCCLSVVWVPPEAFLRCRCTALLQALRSAPEARGHEPSLGWSQEMMYTSPELSRGQDRSNRWLWMY